jgi:hypothetical protein
MNTENKIAEEGAEIIRNMIESIEKYGNYSQEATLTFLTQAKQCFDELKSADPASVAVDRNAVLEAAAKIAMDGPLLASSGEFLYMNDNCKAMALMVANQIRALKSAAPASVPEPSAGSQNV